MTSPKQSDTGRQANGSCAISSRSQAGPPVLIVTALAVLASVTSLFWHPLPTLLWNATSSAPIGLYLLMPGEHVRAGDMVAARLPQQVRALAAQRRYIPPDTPLIKRIAAASGEVTCAIGRRIVTRGHVLVLRRPRDGAGQPLPSWDGCRMLRSDEVLLVTRESDASFDGRYFGPSRRSDILGRVVLLWRR